jgi:hypothetical protein
VLRGGGHRRLGINDRYVEVFERWRAEKHGKVARGRSVQRRLPADGNLNYPASWGFFVSHAHDLGCIAHPCQGSSQFHTTLTDRGVAGLWR